MLILTYTFTMLLLIYGIILVKKERAVRNSARVATVFSHGVDEEVSLEPGDELKRQPFSKRMLLPVWKKVKRLFQKKLTSEKMEKMELKLLQAGSPFGMSPVEFRMAQLAFLILVPVLLTLYAGMLGIAPGTVILFALGGIVVGLYFPSFYLKSKASGRNKKALKELPDFLDLLTVSIEAGLGFDSALSKVVAKKEGILSVEFQRCLEEMRLGKTRKDALSGVRRRMSLDDVNSLIGSIIQAESLGIGMVQVLRVQSNEIRERRKQRAEEAAMKAPVKMLFPLVLFIFPTIFIILLGPAIIQILETF